MSWTQVYVSGLSLSVDPTDEELETLLDARYGLTIDPDGSLLWAGLGSTLVKRDEAGFCRGYAFLAFYSADGAAIIIERINNGAGTTTSTEGGALPTNLQAELSIPKTGKKGKKQQQQQGSGADTSDIRMRRNRKAPVRKHPVIISSNGKKTGLGNKTR